jgi:hypothetical protein
MRRTDDQGRQLAVKAKALGLKTLLELTTSATPDTLLRWHRELVARKLDHSGERVRCSLSRRAEAQSSRRRDLPESAGTAVPYRSSRNLSRPSRGHPAGRTSRGPEGTPEAAFFGVGGRSLGPREAKPRGEICQLARVRLYGSHAGTLAARPTIWRTNWSRCARRGG